MKTLNIVQSAMFAAMFATVIAYGAASPIAAFAKGPAVIPLGMAADFVVLSKAGISTTGATLVEGNIGVSPVAASYITGFGLMLPTAGAFSTSALVTGKVYAPDYASPTATGLTTAVLDMQTAYNNGSGRTPDVTELGAGNIGGRTITPGVYAWSSGLLIPTDVTLSGGAEDTWIFQVAQTLDLSNGAKINLSGGAQAGNVFWVVAGQTTVGTTAVFSGNVLDKTGIVLNTGAVLNGRALAQTSVTFDANMVTIPTPAPASISNPVVTVSTPSQTQLSLDVISPNGGEVWNIGEQKMVRVRVVGAPAASYVQISLVSGPTPIDINGQLDPNGDVSVNYTLPKSGCRTDMCFDVKTGEYKIEAVLYDKAPCNMRANCVQEKRLASDTSDAAFTVVSTLLVAVPTSQSLSNPTSCPAGKTMLCSAGMLRPDGTDTTVCTCVDAKMKVTPTSSSVPSSPSSNFGQQVKALATNLVKGSRGADVTVLQLFLISQDKGPAAKSLATFGGTSYFGPITKAALAEFQASVGLPSTGNFGIKTRAYLSI